MKAKEIIIKAMRRAKEERGLRTAKPNETLSAGHMKKADHNLIVMTDLSKLGHEDWVVIAAYYAMYQSATALLIRIGLESKDHATTAAVLEYFFGEHLTREALGSFNELKNKLDNIIIQDHYLDSLWSTKRAREAVQYGISITYKEKDTIMKNAREFVTKIKLVLNELDERLVEALTRKINTLPRMDGVMGSR